jgi:uncharacterized membrane protein HdeD (DUF308 family)
MIESLSRYWWVPVVRGLCGILFGVIAFANPGVALTVLVLWFGAWALVDGSFSVASAIGSRKSNADWGLELVGGILGIVVGILTFRAPGITALGLVLYIAAWSLVRGAIDIVLAIRLRREIQGEWLLVLAGIASIVFAALLMWNPGPGALALLWLIASYAIVFGVLAIIFGIRARGFGRRPAVA